MTYKASEIMPIELTPGTIVPINSAPSYSFKDLMEIAKTMAESGILGTKSVAQVFGLMAIAQAEGLPPAIAARDYHIINGKPALKADTMLSRFQSAGGKIKWLEYTDTKCKALFQHPQGDKLEIEWTIERATRAELTKNPTWKKYPRQMLKARVISEGIRAIFPQANQGLYTPEEQEDIQITEPEPRISNSYVTDIQTQSETNNIKDILCTPNQRKYIFALCNQIGISRNDEIKKTIEEIVGHVISSTKTLTKEEARHIIDTLKNNDVLTENSNDAIDTEQVS